jgi:RND family efflux transporter MFP subunit
MNYMHLMSTRLMGSYVTVGLLIAACGDNKNGPQQGAPPPAVSVNTYTVQQGEAVFTDQYPATVTALNQVEVRPQVSGYINGIFFQEGQKVSKGQKLYSIDQQQYRGVYEQAVANLNVSKANLAKAQQDADRYEELAKQDAIARQTLDHALADLDANKKQVQAAQANVSTVETNLKYATIYAPFGGTIGISQVKMGTSVSPGQTLLNTLSSDDPMAVDIQVDDKQIGRFTQLKSRGTRTGDSTFRIILPGGSPYSFPGHISFLDRAVDPTTGTLTVRLIFPNPQGLLKPGLPCNLTVLNNTAQTSILIPFKAVVEQMGEYFVFTVDSNRAVQRKVMLGPRIREKVVVNEGLKVNERIVSDGVQKLHDGSAIRLPVSGADSTKNKSSVASAR